MKRFLLIVVAAVIVSLWIRHVTTTREKHTIAFPATTLPQPIPTNCRAVVNRSLPDPRCTPGAFNKAVTQRTINKTICVVGWSSSVRPPVTYTEPLKSKMMRAYGYSDSLRNYEFDHLVPIELGGDPVSIKNLWPEPHVADLNGKAVGSFVKDGFENSFKTQVCKGVMKLSEARKEMVKGTWEAK